MTERTYPAPAGRSRLNSSDQVRIEELTRSYAEAVDRADFGHVALLEDSFTRTKDGWRFESREIHTYLVGDTSDLFLDES